MHKLRPHFSFSPVAACSIIVTVLSVTYVGLIAVIMSYATLTIEFSQSVRNNEAVVAVLESRYLADVARIAAMDYAAAGYVLPVAKTFVPSKSTTASR